MTTDLTKELAAIQARADMASKGPWVVRDGIPGPVEDEGRALEQHHPLFLAGWDGDCTPDKPEDSSFIAHARVDVPRLVSALQAVVEVHRKASAQVPTYDLPPNPRYIERQFCSHCKYPRAGDAMHPWPCPTIRAIEQALEAGA